MKKSKLLAIVITLALVVTMIPTTLFADGEGVTEYDLYVGGVRVTSENVNDVLSDGGTVKYDAENGVLTLNGANINMGFVDHGNRVDHYSGVSYFSNAKPLKINLIGRNTIAGNVYGEFGMGMFILEHTELIIGGDGQLDIDVPNLYEETYGIRTLEDTNTVFNERADVNIFTSGIGIQTKNITICEQSKVKVDAEGTGVKMGEYSYSLEKGILNVQDSGIFEVNTAGVDSKAFERIDTDAGNIKDVKALVGQSRIDVEDEPWAGDIDGRNLTNYKFVRFPYEAEPRATIRFTEGDQGEGRMDSVSIYKGGRFTLPKCDFTGLDDYGFYCWSVDDDFYRPGDRVTIDNDTTIQAIWKLDPLKLFIGGVQVNSYNQSDVFDDGTVSVTIAKSPGDRPGEIIVKLKNATIECDKQDDGDNANTEFGINYKNQGNNLLRIILEGENKIVNKKTYAGITQVEGIKASNAEETVVEGDGTLDVKFNSERKDGKYFGIHTCQQTTIDKAKVNVNINGDYFSGDSFDVKGFYLDSDKQVNLKNRAELVIHSDNRYAFDNNTQNNVDIDVEEGSLFQASCKWTRTWGALHGNKWVSFSEGSVAQGVVVSKLAADEKLSVWDGTTDLGTYKYVRVPEVTPWSKTDSLPTEGKYYLVNNVELNEPWEVDGKDVEINLNGRTITSTGNVAKLINGADVTFTNSVQNHGSIRGEGDEVIKIDDKSVLEMNSVSFYPVVSNSGKGIINNGTLKTRDTMIYARGTTTTPGYAIHNSGTWDSLSDNVMFIQADVGGIALYNMGEATITDTNMEASGAGDTQSYGIYQSGGGVVYLVGSTAVKGDAAGIKAVNEKSIYATSKDGKNSFVGDVITLDCNDKYAPYDKAVVLNVKKDIKDKFVLAAPENAELYYRNAKIFLVTKGSEPSEPETTTPTPKPTPSAKKANTIKVTAKKKTIKAKKLKKKSLKVKALKVKNAVGKVTFKKVKKGTTKKIYKKVKITNKGILKFKKGKYKKKTYKIKVKIRAAGNANYLAKTLTKKIKVKVK